MTALTEIEKLELALRGRNEKVDDLKKQIETWKDMARQDALALLEAKHGIKVGGFVDHRGQTCLVVKLANPRRFTETDDGFVRLNASGRKWGDDAYGAPITKSGKPSQRHIKLWDDVRAVPMPDHFQPEEA